MLDAAACINWIAVLAATLACARSLSWLTDERRTKALARQTIREMLFLVLDGPYGTRFARSQRGQ